MTDVRRDTGSAELDRILAERKRIHAEWPTPRRVVDAQRIMQLRVPSPPPQKEPPLKERIAEARKLRGTISETQLHFILNAIYGSARDNGEYVIDESFRNIPPEITSPGSPTIANIQTVVAEHFNLTREEMLSVRRAKRIMLPRHTAMYLSALMISRSLEYIGERFGFDHSTITHAVKKIERLIAADAEFAEEIEVLKAMVLG